MATSGSVGVRGVGLLLRKLLTSLTGFLVTRRASASSAFVALAPRPWRVSSLSVTRVTRESLREKAGVLALMKTSASIDTLMSPSALIDTLRGRTFPTRAFIGTLMSPSALIDTLRVTTFLTPAFIDTLTSPSALIDTLWGRTFLTSALIDTLMKNTATKRKSDEECRNKISRRTFAGRTPCGTRTSSTSPALPQVPQAFPPRCAAARPTSTRCSRSADVPSGPTPVAHAPTATGPSISTSSGASATSVNCTPRRLRQPSASRRSRRRCRTLSSRA